MNSIYLIIIYNFISISGKSKPATILIAKDRYSACLMINKNKDAEIWKMDVPQDGVLGSHFYPIILVCNL